MSKLTDKLTTYIDAHSTEQTYPTLLSILNDVIELEHHEEWEAAKANEARAKCEYYEALLSDK